MNEKPGTMIPRSVAQVCADLDYTDSVAACILDLADSAFAAGDAEGCLRYTHVAATVLSRQNRVLFSPRVERNLRCVSALLFPPIREVSGPPPAEKPREARTTSLHVLSEALPAGGLTAMASRWMAADSERTQAHVALLSADLPAPRLLVDAVNHAHGTVHIVPAGLSLTGQARWLRRLAHAVADHVVLHIDVSDVVCGAAFGSAGGPPVVLVNQNAHLFWTGVGYADRIANCRGSELEMHWTSVLRNAPRACFVPIPLDPPSSTPTDRSDTRSLQSRRDAWRARTGIPATAVVMVSVGARFKYSTVPESDFVDTFIAVLGARPQACLVVAGFDADTRWARACARTNGRIKVLGRLPPEQLRDVYLGADLYVEGFPFGTTTALLEAASAGVACVLAPRTCPPPYATDGAAIDGTIPRSASLAEYIRHLHHLIDDEAARLQSASRARESVNAHHVGEGWKRHLDASLAGLPRAHTVYACGEPPRTPSPIYQHWARFSCAWTWPCAETLEHAIVRALTLDLLPRFDRDASKRLATAMRPVAGSHMPLWLVVLLCNHLLPVLPPRAHLLAFRAASFAARPGLVARLRQLGSRAGRGKAGAYSEYRVKA